MGLYGHAVVADGQAEMVDGQDGLVDGQAGVVVDAQVEMMTHQSERSDSDRLVGVV